MEPYYNAITKLFILVLLLQIQISSSSSGRHLCLTEQHDALLQFKKTFVWDLNYGCGALWQNDTDCCMWDRVTCDNKTGDVIRLDLSDCGLQGTIDNSSPLVFLQNLQSLDLSWNLLNGSLSSFPQLPKLLHLYLGYCNLQGTIDNISSLVFLQNLQSLDLSGNLLNGSLSSFPQLPKLLHLYLVSCNLQGTIDNISSLVFLQNLQSLDLSGNLLNGSLSSFPQLPKLLHLYLRDCNLQGTIDNISSLVFLQNLQSLDLSGNLLNGSLSSFPRLPKLLQLDLSYCELQGTIDHISSLVFLRNLQSLDLSGNLLNGSLSSFPQLPKLLHLYLRDCNLQGTIDNISSLVFLQNLQSLDLSRNLLNGPLSSFPQLPKLLHLYLSYNSFSGITPCEIAHSSQLISLDLTGNYNLTIASSTLDLLIQNFTNLQELRLDHVRIDGVLASSQLNLPTALAHLSLYNCSLRGRFPDYILNLPNLHYLDVGRNLGLTGTLSSLNWSSPLFYLDLSSTSFSGSIPNSICSVSSLERLYLSGNTFSGLIPHCLGNLTNLQSLDMSLNQLTGPLPRSLNNCTLLTSMDVSSNMLSDMFPSWLIHLPNLYDVYLGQNRFYGLIDKLVNGSSLYILDLHQNSFSGHLPELPRDLVLLPLSKNDFTRVPLSICESLPRVLDLSNNSFTGTIPPYLLHCSEAINLGINKLEGAIPDVFAENSTINTLIVSRNQLTGPLPRSMVNCKMLEFLDLSNNNIEDSFPNWVEALPNLEVLVLRYNRLNGELKTLRDHPFPKLMLLDISNNNLTGLLPIKYFSGSDAMKITTFSSGYMHAHSRNVFFGNYHFRITLTVKGSTLEFPKVRYDLILIDFSNNNFQGEIPEAIGKLNGLKGLNFSHNNLTGSIPRSIQNLTSLEGLDLSSNQLSGVIPSELTNLTELSSLNLSYNELEGMIPSGKQFNTFGKESFVGNTRLCGPQVEKSCVGLNISKPPQLPLPPTEGDDFDAFDWKIILMGYGCGLTFGISIGYMVFELRRPEWFVLLVEEKLLIARSSRWKN